MNKQNHRNLFYPGLSGLQLPVPKRLFPSPYQNASRLTYYSTFFNSIEINSSFYKLPMATTVSKWSAMVNESFKFTFKFWKEVTHVKGLDFKKPDVELFLKTVAHANDKKGCLLIQFPASLGIENMVQLEKLLEHIKLADSENLWNIAVEFRNNSWYNEKVRGLLDFYRAAIVIHDKPGSATPMLSSGAGVVYLRFHGPTGNFRGSYSTDFLSVKAGYIKGCLRQGKTVYAYFNNTLGEAFNNSLQLNNLIQLQS